MSDNKVAIPTTEDLSSLLTNTKITDNQRIFIAEYINNGFNGTQAYLKSGLSQNYDTARVEASKILANPNVKQAIKDYLDEVISQYKGTLEYEILEMYKLRAFYDTKDIIDDNGKLVKPMSKLGDLTKCVEGIEKTYNRLGNEIIKIKLANREIALEKLANYMKLLVQKIELPETVKLVISKEDAEII
jgi:hypothetical protein